MPFIVEVESSPGPDYANKILNPDPASKTNPDYPYDESLPALLTNFTPKTGETYTRQNYALGRVFNLQWMGRLQEIADQLRQFDATFRRGWFHFFNAERDRYFAGRFATPLVFSAAGYNKVDVKGQFVELCGKPMYSYPANWDRDAIFIEEQDDDGNALVKLTGAGWGFNAGANHHAGGAYISAITNNLAEWVYFGYGFRVWSEKGPDLGKVYVVLDGVDQGAAVDLYAAAWTPSAPVSISTDVPLGMHRVGLRVTGTKNGASTAYTCVADAIEVMQ